MAAKAESEQLENHFKTNELKQDRKSNIIVSALVFLVMTLAVVRVVIANAEVEAGEKLRNLDKQIAILEEQNQLRSEKIRSKESLISLEAKAAKQGFQKTGKYAFVEKSGPVAQAL